MWARDWPVHLETLTLPALRCQDQSDFGVFGEEVYRSIRALPTLRQDRGLDKDGGWAQRSVGNGLLGGRRGGGGKKGGGESGESIEHLMQSGL